MAEELVWTSPLPLQQTRELLARECDRLGMDVTTLEYSVSVRLRRLTPKQTSQAPFYALRLTPDGQSTQLRGQFYHLDLSLPLLFVSGVAGIVILLLSVSGHANCGLLSFPLTGLFLGGLLRAHALAAAADQRNITEKLTEILGSPK